MSYIDEAADAIRDRVSEKKGRPTSSPPELLLIYAVLLLAKGTDTTLEDLHNAWAAWRATTRPDHPDLIPFPSLSEESQDKDRPYLETIHELAADLTARPEWTMDPCGHPLADAVNEIGKRGDIADMPRLQGVADIVMQLHCEDRLYGRAADEEHPDACPHDLDSDWHVHFEGDDGEWYCTDRPVGRACRCGAQWPCAEYAAVLAALTRERNTGG